MLLPDAVDDHNGLLGASATLRLGGEEAAEPGEHWFPDDRQPRIRRIVAINDHAAAPSLWHDTDLEVGASKVIPMRRSEETDPEHDVPLVREPAPWPADPRPVRHRDQTSGRR